MKMQLSHSGVRAAALAGAALGALVAGSAAAQDGAAAPDADALAEVDEFSPTILVTGSRIRGIEPTGSPVIGLSRDDIEASAASTTTELLSELPQVFNFGATDASFTAANNQNANRTFGTGINLRGLGTESTLTLLDGRRLPAAGTQSQYFDPAVIPTMAIARLEVLADGSSGIYGSDAVGGVVNILLRRDFDGAEAMGRVKVADGFNEYLAGLVLGRNWGSGSVMVAGEYNNREALFASDRDFYTDDLRAFGGPDLRSTFSAPGNITVAGVTYPIPQGPGTNLTPASFTPGAPNRQSAYLGASALPSQERKSVAATFEQDITPGIQVYAQGFYAHREGVQVGPALSAQFDVPITNPFYVNPGPAGQRVTASYSFVNELGNESNASTQDAYHITGGVNLDIGTWSGNAFFAYGRDEERSFNRSINNGALAAALASTNPATAFNPFSSTGNNDAQTIANIASNSFRVDTNYATHEYGLSFDGPVFELPGGAVRLAVGVARQDVNWQDLAPFVSDFHRQIDSVFGEVFVPILGGSGGPEVNVSAAVRYDDYENIGSTTNPKIGVTFKPIDSLSVRGSYGTSFRAPSLSDAGLPFNIYTQQLDPAGVQRNVLFIRGGNPGLQPEEAKTWSVGTDWEPDMVDGLKMSVTYYNVDYTNRIATPGNDPLALRKPELAPIVTLNPPLQRVLEIIQGGLFSPPPASPTDVYAIVDGRKVNLGANKTDGVEFLADYEASADWGSWRVGVNATKILSFKRSIITGTPLLEVVDTINNPASFVARAYAGAEVGDFSITAFANHYGSYDNNTVTPAQEVPSHTEFDLALRYTFGSPFNLVEAVTLTLDVQDVLNNAPPYVQNGALAFDPNAHSPIGRTIAIGARAEF